jgi:chromate transport protein ChrA
VVGSGIDRGAARLNIGDLAHRFERIQVENRQMPHYFGFNAVRMLFWSAVINGLLAPPLILLVILLTSSRKVMGKRVNSPLLRYLVWATFAVMTAAALGMIITA